MMIYSIGTAGYFLRTSGEVFGPRVDLVHYASQIKVGGLAPKTGFCVIKGGTHTRILAKNGGITSLLEVFPQEAASVEANLVVCPKATPS